MVIAWHLVDCARQTMRFEWICQFRPVSLGFDGMNSSENQVPGSDTPHRGDWPLRDPARINAHFDSRRIAERMHFQEENGMPENLLPKMTETAKPNKRLENSKTLKKIDRIQQNEQWSDCIAHMRPFAVTRWHCAWMLALVNDPCRHNNTHEIHSCQCLIQFLFSFLALVPFDEIHTHTANYARKTNGLPIKTNKLPKSHGNSA